MGKVRNLLSQGSNFQSLDLRSRDFLFKRMSSPLAAHPLKNEAGKRWSADEHSPSRRPIRAYISPDDLRRLAMKITPSLKGPLPPIAIGSSAFGVDQEFETGFGRF